MNLSVNIVLWSTSLFLGIFGIIFGIIASINASKANSNIKKLIATKWITEESHKFFFTNLKNIVTENRKSIKNLKSKVSYYDYSIKASNTRFNLISYQMSKALFDTEYNEILEEYLAFKEKHDISFNEIIKNKEDLRLDVLIDAEAKKALTNHHQVVINDAGYIMKKYAQYASSTRTSELK